MGKTNPTYQERLDQFVDEYDRYRRALRGEYQDTFDEVIEGVHHHAMAPAAPIILRRMDVRSENCLQRT